MYIAFKPLRPSPGANSKSVYSRILTTVTTAPESMIMRMIVRYSTDLLFEDSDVVVSWVLRATYLAVVRSIRKYSDAAHQILEAVSSVAKIFVTREVMNIADPHLLISSMSDIPAK